MDVQAMKAHQLLISTEAAQTGVQWARVQQ